MNEESASVYDQDENVSLCDYSRQDRIKTKIDGKHINLPSCLQAADIQSTCPDYFLLE
jgi:hypothetical protein